MPRGDAEDDVAEHIKQTSVCVERETAFVVEEEHLSIVATALSFRPMLRTVSIMPGMGLERAADGDEQRRRTELGRGRGPGGGFAEDANGTARDAFPGVRCARSLTHLVPHGGERPARRVSVASSSSGQ